MGGGTFMNRFSLGSLLRNRRSVVELLEDRQLLSAASLDTTFNGTGVVTSVFGSEAVFNSVASLPDGSILAAGTVLNGSRHDWLIAKYKSNGKLDTTFGNGTGRVFADFSGRDDFAAGLVLLTGGKFAVVGSTNDENAANYADVAVARYNANGSLDTSFSSDGKQRVDYGVFDSGTALAQQADGKLVIVGNDGADILAARLNTNGSLDSTFGTGGKEVINLNPDDDGNPSTFDFPSLDYAQSVALLSSGKILIGGYIDDAGDSGVNIYNFMAARLNTNGSRDTTFGNHQGYTTLDFAGTQQDVVTTMAVYPDGRFLLGGYSSSFGPISFEAKFALARFQANGSPDNTFSGDGKLSLDLNPAPNSSFTSDAEVQEISIRPDGKVLAIGYNRVRNFDLDVDYSGLQTVRLTAGGTLDTSYSSDGKQLNTQIGTGNAVANTIGGKIVIAGGVGTRAALVRFGTDAAATASISGIVYNDLNGNGVKTSNEPGLAGWQVFVDSNGDGFYTPGEDVATSNSGGVYKITGLLPGTYRVREMRLANWNRTQPAGAYPLGYYDITVGIGSAITGKNFGNKHV